MAWWESWPCITVIDVGLFLLPAAFCFSLSSVYCWEIVYIKTFRFKTLCSIVFSSKRIDRYLSAMPNSFVMLH